MAREKTKQHYSGIGGQAVLEGVMMKNGEKYAVAVRKEDGSLAIDVDSYHSYAERFHVEKIPFVRGVFNFVDSLVLGMRALNFSASFYDEEEVTKEEAAEGKTEKQASENVFTGLVMIVSILIAVGLFVLLPTFVAHLFEEKVQNASLMALIEGGIRIAVFVIYLFSIALMKDIRRLYCYHGAEHKCINCIERGRPLTVKNVLRSSRFHKRCGTSFLFFVVFISIILFFFIRTENIWMRMGMRLVMVPVIAGISYELIRLAGRNDNFLVNLLSAPGMWIQHITTREPDAEMVQVAIASVEAVYDWKQYLHDEFGYDVDDSWMVEDEPFTPVVSPKERKAVYKEAKRLEKAQAKAEKQEKKKKSLGASKEKDARSTSEQITNTSSENDEFSWLDEEEED